MKKGMVLVCALACAISLPIMGCGGAPAASDDGGDVAQEQTSDFDAVEAYWGQWRGSVATSGTSVYGTTGGSEPMLDINLAQDGTCTVEPLETHADLLSDEGTWEGTETQVTLHLETAGDIVLDVVDSVTLEGSATSFDINDFDIITFSFYG